MPVDACYETRHRRDERLASHRHRDGYVSLAAAGSYMECSLDGRFHCRPGTLIYHPLFHSHGDDIGRLGARVLNLPVRAHPRESGVRAWQVADLATAVEVFRRCPRELSSLIAVASRVEPESLPPWQACMLERLVSSELAISEIARDLDVTIEHASRAMRRSLGMPPQLLRREARWRRAWGLLIGERGLGQISTDCGFSDQSHFTRVTCAITGSPPANLRRRFRVPPSTAMSGLARSAADETLPLLEIA